MREKESTSEIAKAIKEDVKLIKDRKLDLSVISVRSVIIFK